MSDPNVVAPVEVVVGIPGRLNTTLPEDALFTTINDGDPGPSEFAGESGVIQRGTVSNPHVLTAGEAAMVMKASDPADPTSGNPQ